MSAYAGSAVHDLIQHHNPKLLCHDDSLGEVATFSGGSYWYDGMPRDRGRGVQLLSDERDHRFHPDGMLRDYHVNKMSADTLFGVITADKIAGGKITANKILIPGSQRNISASQHNQIHGTFEATDTATKELNTMSKKLVEFCRKLGWVKSDHS